MNHFFSKKFDCYDLKTVEYLKCCKCGFVASKKHYEMDDCEWQELNVRYHEDSNNRQDNPYNRNQRYFLQAQMLYLMSRYEMLSLGASLDWGSGRGDLSDRMASLFDITIDNFDKYIQPALHSKSERDLVKRGFSLVINTGVFEHVRSRSTLDEIESYVSPEGCLAVHTLVRETIPKDADWMYLLPVHSSFHTNCSMEHLMQEWGFTCSTYNEFAKMWILYRAAPNEIEAKVSALNTKLGWKYLHFKSGFMDFWR